MRQTDGLQTFFVDAAMQADVDSVNVSAPSTATSGRTCGACCHAGDEQYVRSFIPIDEQLQSGLLLQSVINA